MRDTFDVNIRIKEDMKKRLIFNLQARLPIAMMLGYFGYREQVVPLM